MPRVLLIQGANMTRLGRRAPELYGTTTAAELDAMLLAEAERRGCDLEIVYTHLEGERSRASTPPPTTGSTG